MKTFYVTDLTNGLSLSGEAFAIAEVMRMTDKYERPYLKLVLADKTGKVDAKIWNDALAKSDQKIFKEGSVILIDGSVEDYRGKIQVTITSAKRADESKLDDFIEKSQFDATEMMSELMSYIEKIEHKALRSVVQEMFQDEVFKTSYKFWPAAKSVHHDFRSGLLQHVLEMLNIAYSMKKFYPMANYDILTAGIILHDMGKFEEFSINGISTEYSKKGILVGHIPLGALTFDKYAKGKLSEDLYYHMLHMILAHHGEQQYGSPIVPATIEAVMLSYIDRLSDKARCAVQAVEDISPGEEFGKYNPWMENARFWKGGNYDDISEELEETLDKQNEEGDQLIFSSENE